MGKVFHANPDTHRRVQAYCQSRGIVIKDWVDQVIRAALEGGALDPRVVQKRPLIIEAEPNEEDVKAAYEAPPFWANPSSTTTERQHDV